MGGRETLIKMTKTTTFDPWPQKYESWFTTPLGKLVLEYEKKLVLEMVPPVSGEMLLDAGCGTGIFTSFYRAAGSRITGLDLSLPMLNYCRGKLPDAGLLQGNMLELPFKNESFDTVISVTALEFIENAASAVDELFRVTRPGGRVLVATLNSLSSWAVERIEKAAADGGLFSRVYFRSPHDLELLRRETCRTVSVVHFSRSDDPEKAREIEKASEGSLEGAFAAALWEKPLSGMNLP